MSQKQSKSSYTRKKATVYALDGMLSIVLAIIILISANTFLTRIEFNRYVTLNPNEIGSDIFNILERTDKISEFYLLNKEYLNNKVLDHKNDNHAILKNNTTLKTDNFFNFYLSFDGTKNYVELPPSNNIIKNNSDFTIIIFFSTKHAKEEMNLLTLYSHALGTAEKTSIEIKLENKSGYKNITLKNNYDSTQNKTSIEYDFNNNNINMISVRYENSQKKAVLNITNENGYVSEEIENILSTNFSNANARLGTKTLSENFYKGNIHKVLIFNKTLNDDDLNDIFTNKDIIYTRNQENIVIQYELQPEASSINNQIDLLLPIQYNMRFELENINNTIISTQPRVHTSITKKYISTGERIIVVKDNEESKILRGRYYVWT